MEKQRDFWIRWSYRCNGWMWSVMQGAMVIAEGCEETEVKALAAAKDA